MLSFCFNLHQNVETKKLVKSEAVDLQFKHNLSKEKTVIFAHCLEKVMICFKYHFCPYFCP